MRACDPLVMKTSKGKLQAQGTRNAQDWAAQDQEALTCEGGGARCAFLPLELRGVHAKDLANFLTCQGAQTK